MPKHLIKESKWEKFFEIISGGELFKVKNVTENEIIIQSSPQEIQKFRKLLANPEELKKLVPHIFDNKTLDFSTDILSMASNKIPASLESLDFKKLMSQLFSEEFLKDQHLSSTLFQDNAELQIATLELNCKTKSEFKRDIASLKMIRSCFSDPAQMLEILSGKKESFAQDTDNMTPLAKNVFKINQDKAAYHSTVKLNYGKLLQILQNEGDIEHTTPPVIASTDDSEGAYCINTQQLLGYLQPILGIQGTNTGIVFGAQDTSGLRDSAMFATVALKALNSNNEEPLIHIVLDLSLSMTQGFDLYKNKIKELVEKIADFNIRWKILITPFSTSILPTQEFTSTSHSKTDIIDYISKLNLIGHTNLNEAIFNSIDNVMACLEKYRHCTILVFTDGQDSEGKKTIEEVEANVARIRAQSEHFTMYTIGYGECYDPKFFSNLSTKLGLTHVHLNNLDEMQELAQYMQNLCSNKFIFKIIANNDVIFMDQVAENDIAILINKVGDDVTVERGGYQYSMANNQDISTSLSLLSLHEEQKVMGDNHTDLPSS